MLYISYAFICLILFIVIQFLSINIGNSLGAGPNDIGIIVTAISILCIVIIVCTGIIVNAINKINKK